MSISMQEETISLLDETDPAKRRSNFQNHERQFNAQGRGEEISTQVLSVSDHLTQRDAIDFWRRYFNASDNTTVNGNYGNGGAVCIEAFCDAVQSEFSTNVFKHVFDEMPNADTVNGDEVMQDFYNDLQNKVSIDQEVVSLNALELFTRRNGLERAIKTLLEECVSRHRAQRSIKLNDTIVQELSEVKKMLDLKSKQLASREQDLKKREQALNREKLEAARDLEAMYNKKLAETEKRFLKETQAF